MSSPAGAGGAFGQDDQLAMFAPIVPASGGRGPREGTVEAGTTRSVSSGAAGTGETPQPRSGGGDSATNRRSASTSLAQDRGAVEETPLIAGRFKLESTLGEGSWGEVMGGTDTLTGLPIAAKVTRQGSLDAVEALLKEFSAYQAVSVFRGRDMPLPASADAIPAPGPGGSPSLGKAAATNPTAADTPAADGIRTANSSSTGNSRMLVATNNLVVGIPQVLHFECRGLGGTTTSISDSRMSSHGQSASPTAFVPTSPATANAPNGGAAEQPRACLVLSQLGPTLEDLRQYCLGSFDEPTVLMIADQMVGRLEHVHRCGLIHRDLKPDNMLMGVLHSSHLVHLIDFGLAVAYREGIESLIEADPDSVSAETIEAAPHVPDATRVGIVGTLRYASARAMRGDQQSRRDDMIALLYCLVFFATGDLPWTSQGRHQPRPQEEVISLKESYSPAKLCAACTYLTPFAEQVFALGFDERPRYGEMRYTLRRQLASAGYQYDYNYCWMRKRTDERRNSSSSGGGGGGNSGMPRP